MSREETLHAAVRDGQLDEVEKALKPTLLTFRKADVNSVLEGWTPLQRAACDGNREIVEILIAKGADLNLANEHGFTALYQASLKGHKEVVEVLVRKGADLSPTSDGWTPLHHVCSEGDTQLFDMLLENGAEVNSKNACGWTALLCAAGAGFTRIVDVAVVVGR